MYVLLVFANAHCHLLSARGYSTGTVCVWEEEVSVSLSDSRCARCVYASVLQIGSKPMALAAWERELFPISYSFLNCQLKCYYTRCKLHTCRLFCAVDSVFSLESDDLEQVACSLSFFPSFYLLNLLLWTSLLWDFIWYDEQELMHHQ